MKGDNIMLNKEKYAKEITEIACNGDCIGMMNGILYPCNTIKSCKHCDFYDIETKILCTENIKKWANLEYKEREIDWNKVPIDTPIYVWDNYEDKIDKRKRYFAEYDTNNDKIMAFTEGQTSWTSDQNITVWDNAEIKEGIDCSEWYKD